MKKDEKERHHGEHKKSRGRPVRSPYFDLHDVLLLDCIRQAHGKMPEDPELVRMVINALCYRISRLDEQVALYVKGILQTLVGVESFLLNHASNMHVEKSKIYADYIARIAVAPKPRTNHMPNTLDTQRLLCVRFIENHPLPSTVIEDILNWIEASWPMLIQFIGPFPCLCSYTLGWDKDSFLKLPLEEGTAGLIRALLAYLHNTTPQNIGKLLKRADRKLFRDSTDPK